MYNKKMKTEEKNRMSCYGRGITNAKYPYKRKGGDGKISKQIDL